MKYLKFAVLAIYALIGTVACQPQAVGTETEYKIAPENLEFPREGGVQYLNVQTDAEVKVTAEAAWCTVSENVSQSPRISRFEVKVEENPDVTERTTVLEVTIGNGVKENVTVIQKTSLLIVDTSPVNLPDEASVFHINVLSSAEYTVSTGNASWLSLKEKEAGAALFEAESNTTLYPRETVITFKSGKESYEVSVTQDGNSVSSLPPDMTGMESDAKTLMKKMHLGLNLGNTLEAIGGETAWGAPYTTEEMIKYFKSLGFNAIRVPCSWNQNLEPGEGYVVRSSWMNRVKEVIDYIVDNDMYAILNIHWDQGWLENDIPNGYNKDVDEQQHAIWTQIATAFRNYDEHLIFAGANEPNAENADHMETLLRYEQTFVDAVRATGGKNAYRVLVVQGPSTNIDRTYQLMNTMPQDIVENRLAAEVHFYDWRFGLLEKDGAESWAKVMYFWGKENRKYATGAYSGRWSTDSDEDYVADQMAKMKRKFWDKGIPVIIGEYSVPVKLECNLGTEEENAKAYEGYMKSRATFNGCVTREAKASGCVPFYWHCQGDLIDRTKLSVTEQASYDAIKEAGDTEYPND